MPLQYSALLGKPVAAGGGEEFSPANLFASGEDGGWWDPSDLSTLWSDDARTTQAVVGGAVAVMDDKSGNGFNMTQTTANQRPILRQSGSLFYLEFDGSNDTMSASFGTTYSQPNYYCVGLEQRTDTANSDPVFSGISTSFNNSFTRPGISSSWAMFAGGTLATGGTHARVELVVTCVFDDASSVMRIDGVEETLSASPGTQGVTGLRLSANAAATEFSTLDFYGLVFTDASFLASLDDLESWMAGKTGVTL